MKKDDSKALVNPLISVVIPIYNIENYLKDCVNSVLEQTYTNLEILLVDDGSSDSCGDLCNQFAKADSRIQVIHRTNGGLSTARNSGTQAATGQYITYIDGDDMVHPEYVEYLYSLLQKNAADMSICLFQECTKENYHSGKFKQQVSDHEAREEKLLNAEQALCMMLYQKDFTTSAWGKLYPTMWMWENVYPEGRIYEDLATTYKLLARAHCIAFGKRRLYYYVQREDSIMHCHFTPSRLDLKRSADEMFEFVEKNYPTVLNAAISRRFSCYCQLFGWMYGEMEYEREKEQLWSQIKKDRMIVLTSKSVRPKNRAAALCTFCGKNVFAAIYQKIGSR